MLNFIRNADNFNIVDFGGLDFGKGRRPTDIDAFMEFDDRLFIIIEAKHDDSPLPYGQFTALTRLCQAVTDGGKTGILVVVTWGELVENRIDLGNAMVREWYYHEKWSKKYQGNTLRSFIDALMRFFKVE